MALPFPATALASSSTDLLVASGSALHLLSNGTTTSTPATDAKGNATGLIRKLALSEDGALAVSCHDDKTLRVWDLKPLKLRSTRTMFKRAASVTFTRDNSIVVTDKVGDVYLYPLDPRETAPAPQGFKVQADPSLNPDADFLLGHVSVVSQHILSPDQKSIITADRDEHIRVSRFPKAYVIERYLFGSEGFVSAIHIPSSRPNILLSAGGEPTMQVWDWEAGKLLSRVDIWPSVLPHRRVRPPPRRLRNKKVTGTIAPSDDPTNEGFYVAPDGSMYPTGQGVCVERIDSVEIGGQVVVLFFSEGCTALHSFVLDQPMPAVHTVAFENPVLGFTTAPGSNSLVVSLDSSYGVTKDTEGISSPSIAIVQVAENGELTTTESPLVAEITDALATTTAPPATLASLSLYPNLALFPRWPGFEEDEELAGTTEDMSGMNGKQLGRLKAQGAPVGDMISKANKKRKGNKGKVAESETAPARNEETTPTGHEEAANDA